MAKLCLIEKNLTHTTAKLLYHAGRACGIMRIRQKLMKIHSKWSHSWRCVTSATNRAALRGGLFCMPGLFFSVPSCCQQIWQPKSKYPSLSKWGIAPQKLSTTENFFSSPSCNLSLYSCHTIQPCISCLLRSSKI